MPAPQAAADPAQGASRLAIQAERCVHAQVLHAGCQACVTACPIGLDIRNGRSDSCIECGNCMDACDDTMAAKHYPLDLIHRARPACQAGGNASGWRIKPLAFAALMLLCIGLAAFTATSLS